MMWTFFFCSNLVARAKACRDSVLKPWILSASTMAYFQHRLSIRYECPLLLDKVSTGIIVLNEKKSVKYKFWKSLEDKAL